MSVFPRGLLIIAICLAIPIGWLRTLWGNVSLVNWLFACGVYELLVAFIYRLNIVKLDRLGRRARGLQPRDPCLYHIFGDTLYSPCDGVVVAAVDGLPDLTPPAMDTEHGVGNHVVVTAQQQSAKILLAHMRSGSITVKTGECMARGQPLGRVGNSGRTGEPHLHIHAERGGETDQWGNGTGAPILFDGRFLTRNDTFVA